jgi:hypothetical protein
VSHCVENYTMTTVPLWPFCFLLLIPIFSGPSQEGMNCLFKSPFKTRAGGSKGWSLKSWTQYLWTPLFAFERDVKIGILLIRKTLEKTKYKYVVQTQMVEFIDALMTSTAGKLPNFRNMFAKYCKNKLKIEEILKVLIIHVHQIFFRGGVSHFRGGG